MTPKVKGAVSGAFADSGFFFSPQAVSNIMSKVIRATAIQVFFRSVM
jgi:hypothetical protein